MKQKTAIITGISGQDGYFLSQLLLNKGYKVYGIERRNSQSSNGNLDKLPDKIKSQIKVIWGDITDTSFIDETINKIKPDELYHLAAQSFVALSFTNSKSTYDINIGGTLNIANAVKDYSPKTKVYFAATSELFGKSNVKKQNENTPFYPKSPYGISKLAGFWTMKNYRENYGLFMSNGILFNHESEVRGPEFVSRKITLGIADIIKGKKEFIELGNIDSQRDWGYAGDYVEAMWAILQHDKPDDFVICTGKVNTIRTFVEESFKVATGKLISWEGVGVNEVGMIDDKIVVKINPEFYRPNDVTYLCGDCSKAKKILGWSPKTSFKKLVKIMINHDLGRV